MTEIAIPESNAPAEVVRQMPGAPSPLALWAAEAHQASMVAKALARTSFVPASMRGRDNDPEKANEITIGNVTAAILTGQELGLQPMASLRSMDIIQGVPGLRAHAMRGLVQSHGHKLVKVSSSGTKVVYRGKRKGEREWQEVEWTIERAQKLGLTVKDQWKKQPETMLIARATGEICRLIASDVLHAAPYCAEELDPATAVSLGSTSVSITAEEVLNAVEPTAVIPSGAEVGERNARNEPAWSPHDGHPDGEFDPWCNGCAAELVTAGRDGARPDYMKQAEKASRADEFRAVVDAAEAAGHMDDALRLKLAEMWKAKSAAATATPVGNAVSTDEGAEVVGDGVGGKWCDRCEDWGHNPDACPTLNGGAQ